MRSVGQVILSIALALTIVAGWQYYAWTRLVRDPGWPEPWPRILTFAFAVMLVAPIVVIASARFLPRSALKALALVIYTWFGALFLATLVLFAIGLVQWVVRLVRSTVNQGPISPEKRQLIARGAAGLASATAAALGAVAVRSALSDVEVTEVGVRLDRLPSSLSGFSIVQLSDIHIGPTIGRSFLEHVVERTNGLRPDAVVITGDLVDGSVASLREHVEPLARLAARYGVYFVTGNHEYYSGAEAWMAELARLGVRVLRNERVGIGDNRASFELAGVDDTSGRGFGNGHGPDYERALGGVSDDREVVLLAHRPSQIIPAARYRVGLQLSGHTHGGQIWPFGGAVRLTEPYVAGLHRHDDRSQIYVSRGTGYWGPPMRLWCPAEITRVVLAPA